MAFVEVELARIRPRVEELAKESKGSGRGSSATSRHRLMPSLQMDWKSGAELGRQVVDAVWAAGIEQIEMAAFALGLVLEKYLTAKFGEMAGEIIKDMWYGIADDIYA